MRRDVFIENDSGGLSVLSGEAISDIIADGRSHDVRFVEQHKALLLELYGDDSMPVRVVVDEPLTEAEEREWLACVRWKLEAPDGRIIVAGGFDPDILADWLETSGPVEDGRGVAVVTLPPGTWRVDLYAHVGSMNGRALLDSAEQKPGTWFRADHPGAPFPLWLAKFIAYSGEEDPEFEALWKKPAESFRAKALAIDTEHTSFVGFLLHLRRDAEGGPLSDFPPTGWFELDEGARSPTTFPVGLFADVEDRDLVSFAHTLLGTEPPRTAPAAPPPPEGVMRVLDAWDGPPPERLTAGPIELEVPHLIAAYLVGMFSAKGTPELELRILEAGDWVAPPPQNDFAIERRGAEYRAGPPANFGGWAMLSALVTLGQMLSELPDGTGLEMGMRLDPESLDDDDDPAIGRFLLKGRVMGGRFVISEASPRSDALADAIGFAKALFIDEVIEVRDDAERARVERGLAEWADMLSHHRPQWTGSRLSLERCESRIACMIAEEAFRHRFQKAWPVAPSDDEA